MIIKVCGLREPGNAAEVAAIPGVSLIGLIFYPKSPRFVAADHSPSGLADLSGVGKVGVFVNETAEEIVRKCEIYRLDYLQLHGKETTEYLGKLRKMVPAGVKFIKAFSIGTEEELAQVSDYEGHCDFFLFDTPTSGYGGSGRKFDWGILEKYRGNTPFLLSGGIGPESVESVHSFRHRLFAGIDVNSRFETGPAMKNISLLTEFIQQMVAAG